MSKKKFLNLFYLAILISGLWWTSCFAADGSFPPVLSIDQYPKVDGSTSTQPFGMLLACRITRTAFAWGSHPFDGTRRLYPTMGAYDPSTRLSLDFVKGRFYMPADIHRTVAEKIQHHGTHESYTNLVRRSADLILVAREPSEDELALARKNGVRIRFTPVALDAFVFIVNNNNPVRNLSVQNICAIYTGILTNWSQVGGLAERINPYQRNKNSGSQEMMEKLVMKGLKMVEAGDLEGPLSMIGPFNAIRHDRKGIGYTFQYFDTHMSHTPEVRTIAVDVFDPNGENIRMRTYPFVSEVVIAWLDDFPKGSPAQIVRDWILSEDGQRLVTESGYVPLK